MPSSMPRPARRIGTTSGLGLASLTPVVGATGVCDVERLDPDVAGRLVGQQRHQLVGQPAEGRGVGVLVAQGGELVGDERVVGDVDAHTRNLACDPGPRTCSRPPVRRVDGAGARRGLRGARLGRRAGRRGRASARTARCSGAGATCARRVGDPTGARRGASRCARPPRALGQLAAGRLHARGHPRAVHHVRRRAGAGPGRPPRLRRLGPQGRRGRLAVGRRARPSAQPPPRGGRRGPRGRVRALLRTSSPRSGSDRARRSGPIAPASGSLSGGGVSERPKEHASKACVGATPPWVQIPPPPPGATEQDPWLETNVPATPSRGPISGSRGGVVAYRVADRVPDRSQRLAAAYVGVDMARTCSTWG